MVPDVDAVISVNRKKREGHTVHLCWGDGQYAATKYIIPSDGADAKG